MQALPPLQREPAFRERRLRRVADGLQSMANFEAARVQRFIASIARFIESKILGAERFKSDGRSHIVYDSIFIDNFSILQTLIIPDALDRERVDNALHDLAPSISRRVARALVESGGVACRGVRAQARDRARRGEELKYFAETIETTIALRLGVFYEDINFLIINKPPGLAAHAGPLVEDSLAARISNLIKGAGLAQRLDRGSSGLMLIGKNREALASLARKLESGSIGKYYRTIVAGRVEPDELRIDAPLRVTDEPMGNRPKVVIDRDGGQPARTHARVLARFERYSYLEVTIETGRTHQIRAHLASAGHAILGDPRYGTPEGGDARRNEWARDTLGVARPLLHCHRLVVPRDDGETVDREAWMEPDFARTLKFFQAFAP